MSSTRFDPSVPTLEQVVGADSATIPDPDGIVVPGENDYASSTNKKNLNAYISDLTRGAVPTVGIIEYNGPTPDHRNAYALGDNAGIPDEKFVSDRVGIESGYIPDGGFNSYSNSGLFDGVNDKDLANIIKKGPLGRANGQETLSGHFLLRGLDTYSSKAVGRDVYDKAMPEILSNKNVSSPDDPAFNRSATEGPVTSETLSGRIKIPRIEGSLSEAAQPGAARVSVEELSKVAIDIMLRATGKDPQSNPGFDASVVQEGFSRVDSESLRAKATGRGAGLNADVDGEAVDLPNDDGLGENNYTNKSYGVIYNPLEPFQSFTSTALSFTALSAAALGAILATGAVLLGLEKATSAIFGKPKDPPRFKNINNSSIMELGKFDFAVEPEGGVLKFLQGAASVASSIGIGGDVFNIYNPSNPHADYGVCIILGFASLVGASYDEDLIIQTSDDKSEITGLSTFGTVKVLGIVAARLLALNLLSDKGYYMNLFREIIKESAIIIRNIKSDPASLLSPDGLSSLVNAKLVRFIDTLAKIGDLEMLQVDAKYYYKFNQTVSDPYFDFNTGVTSDTAAMKSFAKQRIRGSRFGTQRGSALGVNDLPSAHLIPSSYKTKFGLDVFSNNGRKISSFEAKTMGTSRLRLGQSEVASLENVLDAEYVPFYFQDLRTNEIVSFHAFLDDVTDSYTANYNSTSGYGRIDNIQTYKDTKRSVGCTFHVIATNEEDFDYMWWQINKLTTLVYPQWSKGRELQTPFSVSGQTAYYPTTQPFSQIPNATPVIRVRIGDLIRSNYSRFNLKRLFGLMNDDLAQEKSRSTTGGQPEVSGYEQSIVVKPGAYDVVANPYSANKTTHYARNKKNEVIKKSIKDQLELNPKAVSTYPEFVVEGLRKAYKGRYGDESNWRYVQVDNGYIEIDITKDASIITTPTYGDAPAPFEVGAGDFVKDFYNPNENSVIRSFESTMGKGLAAVVTQLQFTWMDGLWGAGDDGAGFRAPRSCKVQMSFEPIHDIAPGLDHEGFNRAPIYPVGNLVNKIIEGGEITEPYGVGSVPYYKSGA